MTDEIPLTGGNVNTVVRVGDTVRRVCGPWSTTVQQLLLHLERTGFAGAPRFLGIDDRGREILTFIPGDVGFLPYIWDDAAVVAAAQLLRQLHDASAGFVAPPATHWQLPSPTPPATR